MTYIPSESQVYTDPVLAAESDEEVSTTDQTEFETMMDEPAEEAPSFEISQEIQDLFVRAKEDPSVLTDYLEEGNRIEFTFNNESYYVEYNQKNGNIQAFTADGQRVDNQVQWNNGLTVDGFLEVGGLLEGPANRSDRTYIGIDDQNNLIMVQGKAELDAHRGDPSTHRDTLLSEGTVHHSIALEGQPTDGDPVDGDPVDGDPVDGDPVDGDPVDGDPVDGDPVDEDGTDVYVFDDGGVHGNNVSSTAQSFGGDGVQVETYNVLGPGGVSEGEATVPTQEESTANVVSSINDTIAYLETLEANDPSWTPIIAGLRQSAADFEAGTETLGDYLIVSDTLHFLEAKERLEGNPAPESATLRANWQSVGDTHATHYPTEDADLQAFLGGETLTSGKRAELAASTEGFTDLQEKITAYNTQAFGGSTVAELALAILPAETANAKTLFYNQLASGLVESGLATAVYNDDGSLNALETIGNLVPQEDGGELPVRVINMSYGTSLNEIANGNLFTSLIGKYPPKNADGTPTRLETSLGGYSTEVDPGEQFKAAFADLGAQALGTQELDIAQQWGQLEGQQEAVVSHLLDNNIVLVMSAGNSADDLPSQNPLSSYNLMSSRDIITVGASDDQNTADVSDDTVAGFSSFGVDFVVDGVDVNGEHDGTSFAAPSFAGILAKVLDANPHLTARDVINILSSDPTLYADIANSQHDGAGVLLTENLSAAFSNYVPPVAQTEETAPAA